MTTSELIDKVIAFSDNLDEADADNVKRRARILFWAQQVFDEVWNFREWWWSMGSDTITVTANSGEADVPEDFQEMSQNGAAYNLTGNKEMFEASPQEILVLRELNSGSAPDDIYSIFGQNTTTGAKKFQMLEMPTQSILLSYKRIPPILEDDFSNENLAQIPAQYHYTVLMPGVIAKSRRSVGDDRDFKSDFTSGLAYMAARERPEKTKRHKMPRSISNKW